ncbi:hypothetical protein BpHYR1_008648 [Brachionus plicatilis]|uniref:Uncharacterized protein n=1 Tax=Brachionus plicatilis TaxID=10195 RepID=A0A3M7TA07_BRAPC|nr:hypothetical protein BpHYR1_008648 [Brachionus plicatilis]
MDLRNHSKTLGPHSNNHVKGLHKRLNKWTDTKAIVEFGTRILNKSAPKRKAIDKEKDSRLTIKKIIPST